ncbi:MAG: hypothetical protein GC168_07705 [Candidatus Hydrogenedens sp.]|nr:hypothetical protein [Candidatus Hydrogenedens sp.]
MKRTAFLLSVMLGVGALLTPHEAAAWGERARQSLSIMGLQVVKQDYTRAFQATDSNYERDVIKGALAGAEALSENFSMASPQAAIASIGAEIELLRSARDFGAGSYFAYRMGALGTVAAQLMLPYGIPATVEEQRLANMMDRDIDEHLESFKFVSTQRDREFIRDIQSYFERRRSFMRDDRRIIAEDYGKGSGYQKFLKEAGDAYFSRAVETMADVWHTVLRIESDPSLRPASREMLAWYFVDEIAYLAGEKRNMTAAERAYNDFSKVNPDIARAYEEIGDVYYGLGTDEGVERGVREWRVAHNIGGPDRDRVAKMLSKHFLDQGYLFFAKTKEAGADEQDYTNALRSFEQALEFDRMSEEAAKEIQVVNVAIQERNERFQTTLDFIAKGEQVRERADNMRNAEDYGNAIQTYRAALIPYEAVSEEFTDQFQLAQSAIDSIKTEVSTVISRVLTRASELIEEGDRAVEEFKFEEGISAYERVPGILAVISDEERQQSVERRNELRDLAGEKIEDAKRQKLQYEDQKRPGGAGAPAFGANRPAGAAGAQQGAAAAQ